MGVGALLEQLLGRRPPETELAGHLADSICAQEMIRSAALRDGDEPGLTQASARIMELRRQARTSGLDPDRYPGLYR